jgi:hypothetical protein
MGEGGDQMSGWCLRRAGKTRPHRWRRPG